MGPSTTFHQRSFLTLCVWLCVASAVFSAKKICNVLDYGAKADKQTDIGPPLLKAYAACLAATTGRPEDSVILVPKGDYSLRTNVLFRKGRGLTLTFDGQIHLAFNARLTGNMIGFTRCQNLVVNGQGTFHGYGDLYRPGGNINHLPQRPRLVRFENCQDVDYSGFNLLDAPLYHLVVAYGTKRRLLLASKSTTFALAVLISARLMELISRGKTFEIKTGDECVTAKSPMDTLLVENIRCINTDGCAIGSFGPSTKGYTIQNVLYRNVTLSNASNGVVVKSYSSAEGIIRNITYMDFTLDNVGYPIKFDNTWGETLKKTKRSIIGSGQGSQRWSDAKFINFRGTGNKYRPLVTLNCPTTYPCRDFKFQNIQLEGSVEAPAISLACGSVDALSRNVFKNSLPSC
ncbi:hypothetical protein H4Q26_003572 [Puccinia striiformis f. sp. tritici PST-130]|nr:hypothetical protein H4Q26_003572 [Puccinia striiformis f. sp. tritici PST-130]